MIYPPEHNYKLPYKNSRDKGLWLTHHFSGWLGSGVKDINGVEIFEGDIVRHEIWEKDMPVTFHDCAFWLGDTDCPLCYQFGTALEIVGHIAEENESCGRLSTTEKELSTK